jgi:hypothetical protein
MRRFAEDDTDGVVRFAVSEAQQNTVVEEHR